MHTTFNDKGEPAGPVEAPAAAQRAKNLIEEFFGLTVTDGTFMAAHPTRGGIYGNYDYYTCFLVSPTGKKVGSFALLSQPADGWVTFKCHDGLGEWEQAIQMAIDNFVNSPEGGPRALGEWKPDPAKLLAGR